MKGNDEVLTLLNQLLTNELTVEYIITKFRSHRLEGAKSLSVFPLVARQSHGTVDAISRAKPAKDPHAGGRRANKRTRQKRGDRFLGGRSIG